MNIYARFFNQETLVHSIDELFDFLSQIPEIPLTEDLATEITQYINSDINFPKHFKIKPHVYFILIKTNTADMATFKANRKQKGEASAQDAEVVGKKEIRMNQLAEERPGWYKGHIVFKRVMLIPGTNKHKYEDTHFIACVNTDCAQSCYNRIVEYLQSREDIDKRSQYPSAKGDKFSFTYMGEELSEEQMPKASGTAWERSL